MSGDVRKVEYLVPGVPSEDLDEFGAIREDRKEWHELYNPDYKFFTGRAPGGSKADATSRAVADAEARLIVISVQTEGRDKPALLRGLHTALPDGTTSQGRIDALLAQGYVIVGVVPIVSSSPVRGTTEINFVLSKSGTDNAG